MNIFKILKWPFNLVSVIFVTGIVFLLLGLNYKWNQLPSDDAILSYYSTNSNNNIKTKSIRLKDIPEHTYSSIIAAEDSYYLSEGNSWRTCTWNIIKTPFTGVFDKCIDKLPALAAKNLLQTQSLHRNPRISKVILLTWKMESILSREQIVELALNKAYFGSGTNGISDAAKVYFGKSADQLNISEAALLAGLVKAPALYNTTQHPSQAKKRRDIVLSKMKNRGMITKLEWETASAAVIGE